MYVCMYVCMYVFMYVFMYVCVHACMSLCMHIYVNTYFVYDEIYISEKIMIFPNIIHSFGLSLTERTWHL